MNLRRLGRGVWVLVVRNETDWQMMIINRRYIHRQIVEAMEILILESRANLDAQLERYGVI